MRVVRAPLDRILRDRFGHPGFRPGQAEMVQAVGGNAQQVFDALMQGKKVWAEKYEKK